MNVFPHPKCKSVIKSTNSIKGNVGGIETITGASAAKPRDNLIYTTPKQEITVDLALFKSSGKDTIY